MNTPKSPTSVMAIDQSAELYVVPVLVRKDSSRTCATAAETVASCDSESVVSDASSTNSERIRRSVTFAKTRQKYWVESHKLYSTKERSDYWISKDEEERTKSRLLKIASRMDKGKPERRSYPYRGLHQWTEKGAETHEKLQQKLYNAVLEEQDSQWRKDVIDTKRLARVCQKVSAKSVDEAFKLAFQDEEAAVEIYSCCTFADEMASVASSMASSTASSRKKKRSSKTSDSAKKSPRTKRKGRRRADVVLDSASKKTVDHKNQPEKKETKTKRRPSSTDRKDLPDKKEKKASRRSSKKEDHKDLPDKKEKKTRRSSTRSRSSSTREKKSSSKQVLEQ